MKTSISTFVHYRYSLEEAIRRYARMGYDNVEIWGGRPHAYCEDMDRPAVARLKEVLAESEVAISSWIPAQFRYPTNLAAPDEPMRRKSVDYIKHTIEVATAAGSPAVSLCPGFSLVDRGLAPSREALLESLRDLITFAGAESADGVGPVLLLEPANRWESDLVVTVDDAVAVRAELGSPPRFGIVVDTGHCHINREPLADIPRLVSGMPVHYHIDDNGGTTDDHLIPGRGSMYYDAFLRALSLTGYDGALAVELGFGYTVNPDEAALESLRWMRSAFARAREASVPERRAGGEVS